MKKLLYILYLSWLCYGILELNAQKTIYQNYTIEDGLPSNTIYRIDQDSKGYIWMATGSGASVYNGKSFKNIGIKDGLKDDIFSLYIDTLDRVWFDSHIYYYNYYENGAIKNTKKKPYLSNKKINYYNSVRDSDNFLYLCDEDYFYKLDIEDFSLKEQISNEDFWLPKYDKINKKYSYNIILKKRGTFKYTILVDDKPPIILDKYSHLKKYILIPSKRENEVWFIEQNNPGVYLCQVKGDSLIAKEKYVENEVVNTVFEDSENNLWFGSKTKGLFLLPANKINSISVDEGLSDEAIYCLALDSLGRIWMGMGNGYLNYIEDFHQLQVQQIDLQNRATKTIHLITTAQNKLFGIIESRGISIIDLEKPDLLFSGRTFINGDSTTSSSPNKTIFQAKNGTLWGGGSYRFAQLHYEEANNHEFQFITKLNTKYWTEKSFVIPGRTHAINENKDGIWIGQSTGLTKLVFNGEEAIYNKLDEKNEILGVSIRDLENVNEQIWVGTVNQGLAVVENDSLVLSISTATHPLGNDAIKNIFHDRKKQNVWVATNNGVTKISNISNLDSLKFTIYNTFDGLVSNEATDVLVDNNGTVWIATKSGLSYFNENDFKQEIAPPNIFLSNVQILNKDTSLHTHYELKHHQNDLTLYFESIYFNGPIKFKYKLQGRDQEWQTTEQNKVRYSQLAPGDYKFEAYAMNEDKELSFAPVEILFSISPPIWKTWWFILIAMCIVSSLLFSFFKFQTDQLKRKNDLTKLSLRGIRSQMNAHFIFNSLNAIQNYLIDEDVEVSYRYLTKLSRLIRQTLYHSNQPTINLEDEIKILSNYMDLENLRLKTKFDYKIKVDDELKLPSTLIQPMMLQPYIENSIRWGFKELDSPGKILIDFELVDDGYIKCSIVDNGIGRKAAEKIKSKYFKNHKSMGTQINNKRVELLQKLEHKKYDISITDLFNQNNFSIGTKVELILPLENNKN